MISVYVDFYVVQVFFVHKQLFDLASISKVRILVYAPFVWVLHIAKVGSIPLPYLENVEEQKS